MQYEISNDQFRVKVNSFGAELKSMKSVKSNVEYIWESDPDVWAKSAPVLFPTVGGLKNNELSLGGKKYTLGKHGFARESEFELKQEDENSLSFELRENEESLTSFPFPFSLWVDFILEDNLLRNEYTISNPGKETMYFGFGTHPGFTVPFAGGKLENYFIEFNKDESMEYYQLDGLLLSNTIKKLHNESNKIFLTRDLFDNDALVFKNINSDIISIKNSLNEKRIEIDTYQAPHLGIWAMPGAPYVCIEPWFTYNDPIDAPEDFKQKDGIISLEPGEKFKTGISIKIIE